MHEQDFDGTKRLYYEDSEMKEFSAIVLSCNKLNDSKVADAQYSIVLDKTAFFPEGGGQDGDEGTLFICDNDDDINPNAVTVLYTKEKDGVIFHYTNEPLSEGDSVIGRINWKLRFDRMQQHTGEHIVSGLVHQRFGYDNVGFRLADDKTTLDFTGPLSQDQISEIEYAANVAVFENISVGTFFPTKEEEKNINYRSKLDIEGQVRLVEIPGVDMCACCAPHTKTTGEVGLIKVASAISYKGGTRLAIICGLRALAIFNADEDMVKYLSNKLSVPRAKIGSALEKAFEQSENRRQSLMSWQDKYLSAGIKEEVNFAGKYLLRFEDGIDSDIARGFVNKALSFAKKNNLPLDIAGIFIGNDNDGYRYIIGSNGTDLKDFAKEFNKALNGKGGGKPEMILGSVIATEEEINDRFALAYN